MSLILYIGGAESDSFVSVSEADSILVDLTDDIEFWDLLSTEEKELRLRMGAQLIGHLPLRGRPVFRGQNLCFPRTCQMYNSRFKIPMSVKKAQVWLAADMIHRAIEARPPSSGGMPSMYGNPSQISLAGLVMVSFSGGGKSSPGGSPVERLVSSLPFPVYLEMKKYISQIRGGSVGDVRTLSTTTEPPIVTTTTVPIVTTTTT